MVIFPLLILLVSIVPVSEQGAVEKVGAKLLGKSLGFLGNSLISTTASYFINMGLDAIFGGTGFNLESEMEKINEKLDRLQEDVDELLDVTYGNTRRSVWNHVVDICSVPLDDFFNELSLDFGAYKTGQFPNLCEYSSLEGIRNLELFLLKLQECHIGFAEEKTEDTFLGAYDAFIDATLSLDEPVRFLYDSASLFYTTFSRHYLQGFSILDGYQSVCGAGDAANLIDFDQWKNLMQSYLDEFLIRVIEVGTSQLWDGRYVWEKNPMIQRSCEDYDGMEAGIVELRKWYDLYTTYGGLNDKCEAQCVSGIDSFYDENSDVYYLITELPFDSNCDSCTDFGWIDEEGNGENCQYVETNGVVNPKIIDVDEHGRVIWTRIAATGDLGNQWKYFHGTCLTKNTDHHYFHRMGTTHSALGNEYWSLECEHAGEGPGLCFAVAEDKKTMKILQYEKSGIDSGGLGVMTGSIYQPTFPQELSDFADNFCVLRDYEETWNSQHERTLYFTIQENKITIYEWKHALTTGWWNVEKMFEIDAFSFGDDQWIGCDVFHVGDDGWMLLSVINRLNGHLQVFDIHIRSVFFWAVTKTVDYDSIQMRKVFQYQFEDVGKSGIHVSTSHNPNNAFGIVHSLTYFAYWINSGHNEVGEFNFVADPAPEDIFELTIYKQ